MTREQATQWFWTRYPPRCSIVVSVVPLSLHPARYDIIQGWVYAVSSGEELETVQLNEFLAGCADLTRETWAGSLDNDSDLRDYIESAMLAAYGRTDACRVRIKR
jgi:hypothetical protein